ncbi:MAG: DegT/DnrJ/EryC1/StrS family aminotransferase [Planctomycetes bacterium]|nr:DegT/DnrJ/EryC1/StrS family aminotransferase [Planctomycetota bacterium]
MDIKVPLSRPDITEAEIEAVTDVLRTPNLSLGPKLREFEKAFCDYIGCNYAVAVNSGTSGLFLCLSAMGIGPGDEVITTPFTFIATSNVILMVGAKPVFVDIDPVTLNIDPVKMEKAITPRTKAIIPVEVFGSPAGFDAICEIARKHNLLIVEDSCEGLGSMLHGKKAGTFGDMSVFAFYPNKQMTTGEGGMILTDNKHWADLCCSLRSQGRSIGGGWLAHERLGYNYRLCDINCVLGIVQLSRIEEFVEKRRAVAQMYQQLLSDDSRIIVPTEPDGCRMSWFVFVIQLPGYNQDKRNTTMKKLVERGIQVSNYFPPVHLQPFMIQQFGFKSGDFPLTESVSQRTIALPFHNNLSADEVKTVCNELKACLE